MRRTTALLMLLTLLSVPALSACGSKTVTDTGANGQTTVRTVPNVHFPKTKFLLHAGLAFGAFHRYISKPYKAGAFKSGAPGRVKALAKAAASALVAYHELKKADDAALSSNVLRTQVHDRIAGALNGLKSLPGLLKAGSLGGIASVSGLLNGVQSSATSAGAAISDK